MTVLTSPSVGELNGSIAGIALLGPWIAAVMVAADLPVARHIGAEKFDGLQPFGAFPEIEMRHHEPYRAAMFRRQRRARPAMREQGVISRKIFQCEIGGVAVVGMQHDKAGVLVRPARAEEIAGGKSLPLVVVARPGGDAVDIGDESRLRLRRECRKIPEQGVFNGAVDVEPPALARNTGREPKIERRPVLREVLPGRQSLLLGTGNLAGEERSEEH